MTIQSRQFGSFLALRTFIRIDLIDYFQPLFPSFTSAWLMSFTNAYPVESNPKFLTQAERKLGNYVERNGGREEVTKVGMEDKVILRKRIKE